MIRVFIHYAAVWFRSIVGRRRNRSRHVCFVMHATRSVSAVLHVLNGRRVQKVRVANSGHRVVLSHSCRGAVGPQVHIQIPSLDRVERLLRPVRVSGRWEPEEPTLRLAVGGKVVIISYRPVCFVWIISNEIYRGA